MELLKDEVTVEVRENKVVVGRSIEEEFDTEEYLRRILQMGQQEEQTTKQLEQIKEMKEKFSAVKEQAEAISKVEQEKVKAERDAEMAKEGVKVEPANN